MKINSARRSICDKS